MDIEFQEPMFQCPSHPSQELVGICASCLRDRLYCLKRKNKLRRASLQNISYTSDSDSDSCLEFDELRLGNFDPVDKKEIVSKKKFLWLTKTKNPRSSSQKEKRTFFSLRSIFHRLRRNKEEIKPDICISHDDSFISIKLDGKGNERSQWECRTVGSSARSSSVCEGKWPYYEGGGFMFKGNAGSSYTIESAMQEEEEKGEGEASSTTHHRVRWRTRMNALVRKKCRVQDKVFNDSNYSHNQYPNPKVWSLSSLYNNYHESRHCIRSSNGTKKSWLRNLTSPKWSLH